MTQSQHRIFHVVIFGLTMTCFVLLYDQDSRIILEKCTAPIGERMVSLQLKGKIYYVTTGEYLRHELYNYSFLFGCFVNLVLIFLKRRRNDKT